MNTKIHTALLLLLPFTACKEATICTEEFAMVGVYVEGLKPDRCLSVRNRTGDTIDYSSYQGDNWYAVATDELKEELKNEQESFTFMGWSKDSLLFSENYVIGADECHIYKVSGKDTLKF